MNIIGKLLIKRTVNSEPDTHHPFQRFDMYIGSPLSGSLLNHGIHDLDNRRAAYILLIFGILLSLLDLLTLIRILLSCFHSLMIAKVAIQCYHDFIRHCQYRLHLKIRDNGKIVDRRHIHRIHHSNFYNVHVPLEVLQWNHAMLAQDFRIDQTNHLIRNSYTHKGFNLNTQLVGQSPHDCLVRRISVLHQSLTDLLAGFLGKLQGFLQLFLRN